MIINHFFPLLTFKMSRRGTLLFTASEKLPGHTLWGRCMYFAPAPSLTASSCAWGKQDPGLEKVLLSSGEEQVCCWGWGGQGAQTGHRLHPSAREGPGWVRLGSARAGGSSVCCSCGPLVTTSLVGYFQWESWGCHSWWCGFAGCCSEPLPTPRAQDMDHRQAAVSCRHAMAHWAWRSSLRLLPRPPAPPPEFPHPLWAWGKHAGCLQNLSASSKERM